MRHNLLNPIHKALRAISYNTAQCIQQTNFHDADETAVTLAKIERTLSLLDMHIAHESDFIHPLIANFNIDLHRHLQEMHAESRAISEKVREAVSTFNSEIGSEDKTTRSIFILETFETLLIFNLSLFRKEERVLNQMLWNTCSDEQLGTVEQEIIASVPAETLEYEMVWMMRSLNNLEIFGWLESVRYSAPAFVFQSLLKLADQELPASRYEKLCVLLEPVAQHAY